MREFLHKVSKSLRLDRRDWVVLLLALLLAFSIWFIHNLALKYTDFVTVPVSVRSSIEGHADVSSNSADVVARCRCIGFHLVGMKLRANGKPAMIDVDPSDFHHKAGDTYYLTSKELQNYSYLLFHEGSSVDYFVTDTVYFKFPEVDFKKVPVVLNGFLETDPQFTAVGPLKLTPDSVLVYGNRDALDFIDAVYTVKFKKTGVDRSVEGVLKLEKNKDLRLSDESVRYSLEVVRYVEKTAELPIQVYNQPEDRKLLVVPTTVNAKLRCRFPYTDDPFTNVVFYIDYNDFLNSKSGKCLVRARNMSESVVDYELDPQFVECIVQ